MVTLLVDSIVLPSYGFISEKPSTANPGDTGFILPNSKTEEGRAPTKMCMAGMISGPYPTCSGGKLWQTIHATLVLHGFRHEFPISILKCGRVNSKVQLFQQTKQTNHQSGQIITNSLRPHWNHG